MYSARSSGISNRAGLASQRRDPLYTKSLQKVKSARARAWAATTPLKLPESQTGEEPKPHKFQNILTAQNVSSFPKAHKPAKASRRKSAQRFEDALLAVTVPGQADKENATQNHQEGNAAALARKEATLLRQQETQRRLEQTSFLDKTRSNADRILQSQRRQKEERRKAKEDVRAQQKQIAYEQRLQAKSHQQLATCPSLAVRQSRQSHHAKGASVEQSKKELMAEAKQHQRHMRQVSHMFRQIDQEPIKRVLGADKQELTDKAILGGIHQFSMLQRFR